MGLLIVERGKEPRYVSFIAAQPEDEGQAFGQFVAELAGFIAQHRKVPVYHYHCYEHTHVSKLFERYPGQAVESDVLLACFVDLHAMPKNAFVLPVEGYGLKPVSRWLGFEYGNTKSSATQSMLWYRLWLETGERMTHVARSSVRVLPRRQEMTVLTRTRVVAGVCVVLACLCTSATAEPENLAPGGTPSASSEAYGTVVADAGTATSTGTSPADRFGARPAATIRCSTQWTSAPASMSTGSSSGPERTAVVDRRRANDTPRAGPPQ